MVQTKEWIGTNLVRSNKQGAGKDPSLQGLTGIWSVGHTEAAVLVKVTFTIAIETGTVVGADTIADRGLKSHKGMGMLPVRDTKN